MYCVCTGCDFLHHPCIYGVDLMNLIFLIKGQATGHCCLPIPAYVVSSIYEKKNVNKTVNNEIIIYDH